MPDFRDEAKLDTSQVEDLRGRGRGRRVGKGGVVRDPALHTRVCDEVRGWLEEQGWQVQGIVASPITGPEGNVEFLIAAQRE